MSNSEEFNKLFSSRKETEKLRGEKEELITVFMDILMNIETIIKN